MTRLRRLARERSSDHLMSVEELSQVPWLEMHDVIEAGVADRADMAQALQELRQSTPSGRRRSSASGRKVVAGGMRSCSACRFHIASAVAAISTTEPSAAVMCARSVRTLRRVGEQRDANMSALELRDFLAQASYPLLFYTQCARSRGARMRHLP